MMQTVLLVGGPADGTRTRVYDGQNVVQIARPTPAPAEPIGPRDRLPCDERQDLVAYRVLLRMNQNGEKLWFGILADETRDLMQIIFENYGKATES